MSGIGSRRWRAKVSCDGIMHSFNVVADTHADALYEAFDKYLKDEAASINRWSKSNLTVKVEPDE